MWLYAILAAVALQRLAELFLAQRNTRRLLALGAMEIGRRHYPLIVLLHAAWLVALAVVVPTDTTPNPMFLVVFVALQGARVWVLVILGERWTTRIIVLPGASLVRQGPYRWLRHPNYWIVSAEIAVLPLVFDAPVLALIFFLLNAVVLRHRVRVENQALGYA